MHPLHFTSKWFPCTIMQHQGLGVHRVIKRFSNYYWSHAKGSMQISGRQGHGGFLCFQKNKTFSQSHTKCHTYTEKKLALKTGKILFLTFLRGVFQIAWLLIWCLWNFILQSLTASSTNRFVCLWQNIGFYLKINKIFLRMWLLMQYWEKEILTNWIMYVLWGMFYRGFCFL